MPPPLAPPAALDGRGVTTLLIDDGAMTEEGDTVEVGLAADVGEGTAGEEEAAAAVDEGLRLFS